MIHQGKVKMPFDIKYDIVYKGSFQKKFLVKVGILSQRGGGHRALITGVQRIISYFTLNIASFLFQ